MVQELRHEIDMAIEPKRKTRVENVNNPPQKASSRRSFLNKLWAGLGILAAAEIIALVVAFLRPGSHRWKGKPSDPVFTAGPVDGFSANTVTAFVRGKFYLARLSDGGFLALSRKCTHLGCTVPWLSDKDRFECPCHGSAFDIRGDVIRPPAPRALDIYAVHIENNVVKVDISRVIKRGCFDVAQVVYP